MSLLLALGFTAVGTSVASAAPMWTLSLHHGPTHFQPGSWGQIDVVVGNSGDAAADLTSTVTVRIPQGLTATAATVATGNPFGWMCQVAGDVTCTRMFAPEPPGPPTFIVIDVDVAANASGPLTATAEVSGGGASNQPTESETIAVSATPPEFGVVEGSFEADAIDARGEPERQAGARPYIATVEFDMHTAAVPDGTRRFQPVGTLRHQVVTLPLGFVGNPEATPKCNAAELATDVCPVGSQIGVIDVYTNNHFDTDRGRLPVYNMVPPKDTVADFAFSILGRPVHILATLDPETNRLVARVSDINETFPASSASLSLWGDPANPVHDVNRAIPGSCTGTCQYGISGGGARVPFLTLPSQCGVADTTGMRFASYQRPDVWGSATSVPQTLHGCEKQRFNTTVTVAPDTTQADAPSGLMFQLDVEQQNGVGTLGTPPLRKAVVRLPEGMTVAAGSADGLAGCAPHEIRLRTNDQPTCPGASKIGTVEVITPLLPDPMRGTIYLATQSSTQLLRIYLVLRAPGLLIKLSGNVDPDPATGQLTTTFDENPPLPFSRFTLRFKSGPRAPLATSLTCGVRTTTAELTSWNGAIGASTPSDSHTVSFDGRGAPCPPTGFSPRLDAGTTTAAGGRDANFTLTFSREDREQYLSAISVAMPPGLLGRIASATLCNEAQAAAGTCGEASRLGRVIAGAGPGTNPFYAPGRVYLTGPYKGGPFGLSIVVPVVAGPFDLGTIVVRAAIHVDPSTAAISIAADPMPSILMGIPLRVRSVNVVVDRPRFMFNPSNCRPMSINAAITSVVGQVANVSNRFQAVNCASLAFRPRMTLRVGRRGHTQRDRTTPLTATLTQTPGQASNGVVDVHLPDTINARLPVVNRACTVAEFRSGNCERARIGSATAVTPLLRDPLRGNAYFVRNGRRLPDIMIGLRGQVAIDLVGIVSIPGGRTLRTRFETVPDAPISKFTLKLVDGRNGPIGAVRNLCAKRTRRRTVAELEFRAHSNTLVRTRQRMTIAGCRARPRRRASRRARRGSRSTRTQRARRNGR